MVTGTTTAAAGNRAQHHCVQNGTEMTRRNWLLLRHPSSISIDKEEKEEKEAGGFTRKGREGRNHFSART